MLEPHGSWTFVSEPPLGADRFFIAGSALISRTHPKRPIPAAEELRAAPSASARTEEVFLELASVGTRSRAFGRRGRSSC